MALPPVRAVVDGAGLAVIDYRSESITTDPAGPDGLLTAEFEPVPPGLLWLVQRITVSTDSPAQTRALVYVGPVHPSNFVDGTQRGNLDTADNASGVLVDSSVSLTCRWDGADVGSVGTVRIQYQIVSRT